MLWFHEMTRPVDGPTAPLDYFSWHSTLSQSDNEPSFFSSQFYGPKFMVQRSLWYLQSLIWCWINKFVCQIWQTGISRVILTEIQSKNSLATIQNFLIIFQKVFVQAVLGRLLRQDTWQWSNKMDKMRNAYKIEKWYFLQMN